MSLEVTEIVAKILTAFGSLKSTGKDSHENTVTGLGALLSAAQPAMLLGRTDSFLGYVSSSEAETVREEE